MNIRICEYKKFIVKIKRGIRRGRRRKGESMGGREGRMGSTTMFLNYIHVICVP